MEKQQWLHTLSPLRFPEIPEAVPKEGKQAGSICAHHWGRVYPICHHQQYRHDNLITMGVLCRQVVALIRRLTRRAMARA